MRCHVLLVGISYVRKAGLGREIIELSGLSRPVPRTRNGLESWNCFQAISVVWAFLAFCNAALSLGRTVHTPSSHLSLFEKRSIKGPPRHTTQTKREVHLEACALNVYYKRRKASLIIMALLASTHTVDQSSKNGKAMSPMMLSAS
ncbi:hypothetical protein PYCCODRAFT_6212 [Trametes coccinea BRFM310]|uniref:Uncharacterized protein n=1 Tax=Trametes coccinea (strain BRFM310) TaxID=1353009 RepID=A0A1Y2J653_TRAC3|nr:hypothetical protein PYCCODRAFT_6212 [Trametes coccinea BRFM310]